MRLAPLCTCLKFLPYRRCWVSYMGEGMGIWSHLARSVVHLLLKQTFYHQTAVAKSKISDSLCIHKLNLIISFGVKVSMGINITGFPGRSVAILLMREVCGLEVYMTLSLLSP